LLRCVGRYWHIADKPAVSVFVAYWTNNGQKAALGLDLSAAIDPFETLQPHLMCRDAGITPYA